MHFTYNVEKKVLNFELLLPETLLFDQIPKSSIKLISKALALEPSVCRLMLSKKAQASLGYGYEEARPTAGSQRKRWPRDNGPCRDPATG
jgi:hypothetical protein